MPKKTLEKIESSVPDIRWTSLRQDEALPAVETNEITDAQLRAIRRGFRKFPDTHTARGDLGYMTDLKHVLSDKAYEKVTVFTFPDGSRSFAFAADVRWPGGSQKTHREVFIVDEYKGMICGEGVVNLSPEGHLGFAQREEKIAPYVSWTKTHPDLKGRGLNERRLEVMNVMARREFGKALHSGTQFQDPMAERTWELLVQNGRAIREADQEFGLRTYKFIA